jgi:hypothetical protein
MPVRKFLPHLGIFFSQKIDQLQSKSCENKKDAKSHLNPALAQKKLPKK